MEYAETAARISYATNRHTAFHQLETLDGSQCARMFFFAVVNHSPVRVQIDRDDEKRTVTGSTGSA